MISFIKKFFSRQKNLKPIENLKWYVNHVKVYISPIKFFNDTSKITIYKNMVIAAFAEWSKATNGNLTFEFTDKLCDSHINIDWVNRLEKNSLGKCNFNYDELGRLYSAEIKISLLNKIYNKDLEIYHSILYCVGISLGLSQTNNPEDIMCQPHQYENIELSENDKKNIFDLYGK